MKKLLTTLLAFFAILSIFNTVKADYPEKPITMVIPFGPGGSHDLNARVFTSIIPQYLGNAIIVKLVPGASGQTGTAMVAQAKPDGYTLLSHTIMLISYNITLKSCLINLLRIL